MPPIEPGYERYLSGGSQNGPHALKVARTGKSGDDEFAYEQDYILHLARHGIDVPSPVAATDGSLFFAVQAPEGKRQVVLMTWLEGEPYQGVVSEDEALPMGRLLARMHLAAADFTSPHKKAVATERKIKERLPFLLNLLKGRPDEARFLERVSAAAIEGSEKLEPREVPFGPYHGDLQNANVMRKADRLLAVLTFQIAGRIVWLKILRRFTGETISKVCRKRSMRLLLQGMKAFGLSRQRNVKRSHSSEFCAISLLHRLWHNTLIALGM